MCSLDDGSIVAAFAGPALRWINLASGGYFGAVRAAFGIFAGQLTI